MLKSDIRSNNEAVVDITKFIELLENPDDSDVDQIVRIVERHKPKERSELNVKTFEEVDTDSKDNMKRAPMMMTITLLMSKMMDLLISYRPSKEQFPIIVTQDCGHQETRYVSMSGKQYDDHNE